MGRFGTGDQENIVGHVRDLIDQVKKRSQGQVEIHGALLIEDCDRLLQHFRDVRERVKRTMYFVSLDNWQAAEAELDKALILREEG